MLTQQQELAFESIKRNHETKSSLEFVIVINANEEPISAANSLLLGNRKKSRTKFLQQTEFSVELAEKKSSYRQFLTIITDI